jgi:hypothetical protein
MTILEGDFMLQLPFEVFHLCLSSGESTVKRNKLSTYNPLPKRVRRINAVTLNYPSRYLYELKLSVKQETMIAEASRAF